LNENNSANGHDLIDNKALLAKRQFEGLEFTTQKAKRQGLPEYSKLGIENLRL
jgi:hypothetical protein